MLSEKKKDWFMPTEFKDFDWFMPIECRDFDWYIPIEFRDFDWYQGICLLKSVPLVFELAERSPFWATFAM